MKAHTDRSWYLKPLITIIAFILFSTAGIARIAGWGPNSADDSGDTLALDPSAPVPVTNEVRFKARCPECGVIVSMREIEVRDEDTGRPRTAGGAVAGSRIETRVDLTRSYEITVRLADGTSRVFNDANPARWRSGERVIVIDGANPSIK